MSIGYGHAYIAELYRVHMAKTMHIIYLAILFIIRILQRAVILVDADELKKIIL